MSVSQIKDRGARIKDRGARIKDPVGLVSSGGAPEASEPDPFLDLGAPVLERERNELPACPTLAP
ncbi:hypothetical protein GCM10025869_02180 [Homoserinibacter gongjuensis]|uniref:Uncharacterized protein n=1 Tax=Homoserinibacter gongjuensis TaxID=1162968 RepID=A0ABQ6JRC4_9MICO|nr:hypothetical protein GCM10025869_02180 [Homoserinibacter gongjuensis]